MRNGAYGQVSGLVQMAGAGDLDEPRRRQALGVLADNADEFAIVLSAAQRQELAAGAESIRSRFPEDARGQIDTVKSGLTGAACGTLCKF